MTQIEIPDAPSRASSTAAVSASWADVEETFRNHIAHYAKHGGGENALRDLQAERAVSLQYSGRVVYELLQNALDRARRNVSVSFGAGRLIVGNDGQGLSVDPAFEYRNPKEGAARKDFNALCSLHSSNKDPDEALGNKGIGFRSVFGVARSVTIWSRCADGGWWGLELETERVPVEWGDSVLSDDVDATIRSLGARKRPSFHFPRPLRSADAPFPGAEELVTVVIVPVDDEEHQQQIAHEIGQLRKTRFQFIDLRRPGLRMELGVENRVARWPFVSNREFEELATEAKAASHAVATPRVTVAWVPAPHESPEEGITHATTIDAEPDDGLFYNYLPTRMRTGLPVDIHADFQLKADRDGMNLDPANPVGKYNVELLERAAADHVTQVFLEVERGRCRSDLWRLVSRPTKSHEAWERALADALFPDRKMERWVSLAERFFADARAEDACRAFWDATGAWLDALVRCSRGTQTWKKEARKLCETLAERKIPLIPVASETGSRLVPLPSKQDEHTRAERRVFYRERAPSAAMPQPLLALGRSVTAFDLGDFADPAYVDRYEATKVLRDLRQIPNDPADQDRTSPLSEQEQGALLAFAWDLLAERRDQQLASKHFAWRSVADGVDSQKLGRALSTLYLPVIGGGWEPARQLSEECVDVDKLARLMGVGQVDPTFLRALGVAPAGAVPLVEGPDVAGDEYSSAIYVVETLTSPPRLQAPGNRPAGILKPRFDLDPSLEAMLLSVGDLSPDHEVRTVIRRHPWLPSSMFRQNPELESLPERVAPDEVIVPSGDRAGGDRRTDFLAVPANSSDIDALRQLGALEGLDSDATRHSTVKLIHRVHQRCPVPARISASAAVQLAALYNLLVRQLPDGSELVPILLERCGELAWRNESEEAWLVRPEHRSELRRFFADLPLVAADYRSDMLARLDVREAKVKRAVRGDDARVQGALARIVHDKITSALPVLLAAAEQSRQTEVDIERVQSVWLGEPIRQVEDAWVEVSVVGPTKEAEPWRRYEYDDVFLLSDDTKKDPGVVLFDTKKGATQHPPLRRFGKALALQLVNNVALGGRFAEVLSALEDGRGTDPLEDFVRREHLEALRDQWARELATRLAPLSAEDGAELRERLARVCKQPDATLARWRIERSDLLPDLACETGAQLQIELEVNLKPELLALVPRVQLRHDAEQRWDSWLKHHGLALFGLLSDSPRGNEKPVKRRVGELQQFAESHFDHVHFDPSNILRSWVSRGDSGLDVCPENLEQELEEYGRTFEPVTTIMSFEEAGWSVPSGSLGSTQGGPEGKVDPADLMEQSEMLGAWGTLAEKELLDWVIRTTRPLLAGADADASRKLLLATLPKKSDTRKKVDAALKGNDLQAALHIAQLWSGAGFDILGLELDDDRRPIAVRYECKGLKNASKVTVHLSRRELAVAKEVREQGPGKWRLIGLKTSGQCVDLTSRIEPAFGDAVGPLHAAGLAADGMLLVIEGTREHRAKVPSISTESGKL